MFSTAIGTLHPGRSPYGGCKGGAKALPFAADARPGVAQSPRRDLRRGLVDEDPADPVGVLGLHDDLEVPVIVVPNRRPVPLQYSRPQVRRRVEHHFVAWIAEARGERAKVVRSEERRVGKECRTGWSAYH